MPVRSQNPSPLRRAIAWLLPPMAELRERRVAFAWSLASVALLRLCHPPFALWPLAFVGLVPWLWGLRGTTPRGAFWISMFFGFCHFLTVFTWLGSLSRFNPFIWVGIPLLCVFQGLHIAIAGAGMVAFARRLAPWPAFALSALWWAGWEWWRSIGPLGSPFILMGHAVRDFLPLIQVTSLGGIPLLSALLVAANLALMETTAAATRRMFDLGVASRLAAAIALVVGGAIWGGTVMHGTMKRENTGLPVRVTILQPNVEQERKFRSYAASTWEEMREIQNELTLDSLDMLDALEPGVADLVVLPESAFTQFQFDHDIELQAELRDRARSLDATIICGANDIVFVRPDGSYSEDYWEADTSGDYPRTEMYGGLYVFRPEDEELKVKADYHKTHLMPFGECLPYFDMIPGLAENVVKIGTFLRGDRDQPAIWIDVAGSEEERATANPKVRIGPTICFEDLTSWLHRTQARRGATLFVNITNNAWFDPSLGSRLHGACALMRSPETRLPMVMATNTGVSCVVDGTGRVIGELPLRERATETFTVNVPRERVVTLYSRLGDWFGILGFAAGWVAVVGGMRRDRREERHDEQDGADYE